MKKVSLMRMLVVCITPCLIGQKALNPLAYSFTCEPKECLPELPRNPVGKSFRGRRYPWYYQGYPYYGVYTYGSYRGQSWGI